MVIRKIELQILRLRVPAFCLFVMEGSTDLRFDQWESRARRVEPSSLSPPVFFTAAGSTAGKRTCNRTTAQYILYVLNLPGGPEVKLS